MVRIRFSVWLVTCYAHVFARLWVVIVTDSLTHRVTTLADLADLWHRCLDVFRWAKPWIRAASSRRVVRTTTRRFRRLSFDRRREGSPCAGSPPLARSPESATHAHIRHHINTHTHILSMPEHIRAATDIRVFRKLLKTHLFNPAFNVYTDILVFIECDYWDAPMFSM